MTDDLFMIKVRQVAWELFKDKKMLVPALRFNIIALPMKCYACL
jgi:hypothetical protein